MHMTEDVSGTLRAQEHGHQPLILANQQSRAYIGEGVCPTITAAAGTSGNHQPVLFENHGIDARYTRPHEAAPTMSARYGTGGNNVPLVVEEPESDCISGNIIDRQEKNGGNGFGCQSDISYTLTATDRHAVFSRQRSDEFIENEVTATQSARQHKDATDLVCQPEVFGQSQYGANAAGCATKRLPSEDLEVPKLFPEEIAILKNPDISPNSKEKYGPQAVAAACSAAAYLLVYSVKVFFYNGMVLQGLTEPAQCWILVASKLPASVFNGVVAVVFAPILGVALMKAMHASHLDRMMA